jgi:hypothetical protein
MYFIMENDKYLPVLVYTKFDQFRLFIGYNSMYTNRYKKLQIKGEIIAWVNMYHSIFKPIIPLKISQLLYLLDIQQTFDHLT